MVDPQYAGMSHIGAQRRDQRREAAPPQGQRVERRQPPILAGAAQRVGRRADRGARHDQLLVGPGLGAVRIDPDREVAIEAERQPGLASRGGRLPQLAVCLPLQELEELDPLGECAGRDPPRPPSGGRAWAAGQACQENDPPRCVHMLVQHLEHGIISSATPPSR